MPALIEDYLYKKFLFSRTENLLLEGLHQLKKDSLSSW